MRRAVPALLIAAACSGGGGPIVPQVSAPEQVVPSSRIPSALAVQPANNNLDVVRHGDRIFFAWRTAPSHFASPEVALHVVSGTSEERFEPEVTFRRMTDLREPRFLSFDGRLFLYFAVLGDSLLDFAPQGFMVSEYLGPGSWSEPEWVYQPGFIAWRTKVEQGTPYVLAYKGGEQIYDEVTAATEIHWLTTTDGRTLTPVVPGQPKVEGGGGSETDVAMLDDGRLIAVIRNEAGDELRWGSKICRAEPDQLGSWSCVGDPRKYDSPLVFQHQGEVYLIGRRNLNEYDGAYDLHKPHATHRDETAYYQFAYWERPKRCAVWHVDAETLAVEHLVDLPSRGDTCFPALLPLNDREYAVYNYTSPLEGPDLIWLEAQLGETRILRTVLRF
jgi:hypothetical protein